MNHRFVCVLFCRILAPFTVAALLLRPNVMMAQSIKYEVTGFRDARFGMNELDVRLAARSSFGARDEEMTFTANAIDGTTKLIVYVPMLEAGLGEGRVEYFFGYRSQTLIQLNVVRGADTNPPRNNSAMIAGAARLQRYFLGFAWANRSVRAGIPIDESAVLVFSGSDSKNGVVSLVIEGVRYEQDRNGVVRFFPERASPPKLTVSYIDGRGRSDVRNISQGDF